MLSFFFTFLPAVVLTTTWIVCYPFTIVYGLHAKCNNEANKKSNFQLDSLIYYRYYYCGIRCMCSIASMSWYNDNARFFQVFYYNDIASVCLCVFGRYACVFETCCDSHRYVEPPCCCIYIYTIYSLQVFVINPRWLGEGPLRQHDANKIKKTCTSIRAKGNDKTLCIHTCALFFFIKW